MTSYLEWRRRTFDGKRLLWYGKTADEDFWMDYWQGRASSSHYEKLRSGSLVNSFVERLLLQELRQSDKILEAGCGAGDWVVNLTYHGFTGIEGIDFSRPLVDHINSIRSDLKIAWGDALNISAPASFYDGYLSFGVVEHRFTGPKPFFQEAWRVLKPGGKAIFTVPCLGLLRMLKASLGLYRDRIENLPFYQYGFHKREITSLLQDTGFQVERCKYILLDRLWMEESRIYRKAAGYSVLRPLQKSLAGWLEGMDGHMLLVVCSKPTAV